VPRFAANLSMMFGEVPFVERFAAAARAGFTAVEFLLPYAHDARLLEEIAAKSRLEVVLFNLPAGDWEVGDRGLACDPGRVGEFEDSVGRAIAYAGTLRCKRLHCMAGSRPPGVGEDQLRETYVRNLRFAAAQLAKHDLTLLIEGINPRDVPRYYLNTSRQAVGVMDEVGAPNLSFLYDVYHMQIVEGDLATTIERLIPRIGHMQVADTPGRHEPGTGEINYAFLFAHLDRIGYRGWIGCEYRPATTTDAGLGWLRPYLPS
jgi:hydroxypyruvate isomerase